MAPGRNQVEQNAAFPGQILLEGNHAEEQHTGLADQIEPKLLGDEFFQAEPGHRPAGGAEQRHMEKIDAGKQRVEPRGSAPVILNKMPGHNAEDAQAFHGIQVVAAGFHGFGRKG